MLELEQHDAMVYDRHKDRPLQGICSCLGIQLVLLPDTYRVDCSETQVSVEGWDVGGKHAHDAGHLGHSRKVGQRWVGLSVWTMSMGQRQVGGRRWW